MSWATERRRIASHLITIANDGALIVEREHSAKDRDKGERLQNLALSGAHASGASMLTLKAPDSGPLVGTLPANLILTISGADYTIQSTVSAASSLFSGVSISPNLASNEVDAAPVSMTDSADYSGGSFATVHRHSVRETELPEDLIGNVAWALLVAENGAPVVPVRGDFATFTPDQGAVRRGRLEAVETKTGYHVLMAAA